MIGESDDDSRNPLLPSKPHCQLSTLPPDVFQMIVTYVQQYVLGLFRPILFFFILKLNFVRYFTCYDMNRQGLLGAYNPNVTFSLSLNMSNSVAHRAFKFEDAVVRESRNLKRIVGNDGNFIL